jgi:hypothetical protein
MPTTSSEMLFNLNGYTHAFLQEDKLHDALFLSLHMTLEYLRRASAENEKQGR